ncbi:MAG: tetratricopeptide repeat protein [Bdellovibrionota bacterium]
MQRYTKAVNFLLISTAILGSSVSRVSHADIPPALEPKYSEAVIAYNAKQFDHSISLLKELLAQNPNLPEFLEMEALSFKAAKDDTKAAEIYFSLLNLKATAPARERAPYQFELGALHFKANDFEKAQPEFQGSLASGFNPGAAHFFLGMIAYHQKNWEAAELHLEKFRGVLVADLRPAAALYLAQAYTESGYGLGATQAFYDARTSADESIKDPATSPEALSTSKSVFEAANQGLAPLASGKFFSEVGFMTGYDSNALSQPTGLTVGQSQQFGGATVNGSAQSSGQHAAEAVLFGNIGYMTSPLNFVQLVPSYRIRFNDDFNQPGALNGNFVTNTLSLYVNRAPLDRFSYGAKLEGNFLFQDQIDDPTTNAHSFHSFILNGNFGPYVRWQFDPYWAVTGEATFQPQRNFADANISNSPSLFQSGQDYHLKAGVKKTGGLWFLNPGFYFTNDVNMTSGTQYRSETPDIGMDNDIRINDKLNLIVGADLGISAYVVAAPIRVDKTISTYLSFSWAAWKKLTVLATASYLKNISNSADNDAAFAYERLTFSAGASWSIF